MQQEKNPLITRTPVCAGIMKLSAPPETPSLYTDNRRCNIRPTPVIKTFNVLKPEREAQNTVTQGGITFKKIFCNRISSSLAESQRKVPSRFEPTRVNPSNHIEESKGPAVPNAADHGVAYSSIADGPDEPAERPILSIEDVSDTDANVRTIAPPKTPMNAEERRQSHLVSGMAMPAIREDLSIMEASMMYS